MIAAIAIANGLSLHTCDPDDFTGIDGLEVQAIPHPNGDVSRR
jgi:tRNA(fMet)-specific endonuclease VapC